jgi:hypothetical protein
MPTPIKSRLSQNGRITKKKMNKRGTDENLAQQKAIMKILDRFFKKTSNLNKLYEIIDKKLGIPLRLIDWYATNYIKKKDIYFTRISPDGTSKKRYVAYKSYQSYLKSYSKKFFDPFRRNYPMIFIDKNGIEIETAICQLNFFRWLIEYDNWEYIKKHRKEIEEDMQNIIKQNKATKLIKIRTNKTEKRTKRKELSIAATRTFTKHNVKVKVKFD